MSKILAAMVYNGRLGNFAKSSCCVINKKKQYTEITPLIIKGIYALNIYKLFFICINILILILILTCP